MHTVFALLCFVVVIHWLIFPYPSGLLHWHCGNLTIAPVPAKQPWWIWINTSCEFIMNDCITTTKQSTTKPCAYFLGHTVPVMWQVHWVIHVKPMWHYFHSQSSIPRKMVFILQCVLVPFWQQDIYKFPKCDIRRSSYIRSTPKNWQSHKLYVFHSIHKFSFNTSHPGQNGCHFTDSILRHIFMNEKFCIFTKTSQKFIPKGPVDNNPALL